MLIQQLQQARCVNPFEELGLKPDPDGKGMLLRVWLPNAVKVVAKELSTDKSLGEMTVVHEDGLFELAMPRRKKFFFYKLDVTTDSGEYTNVYPYQFQEVAYAEIGEAYSTPEAHYNRMGAHPMDVDVGGGKSVHGVRFAVYAPNASSVSLIGEFNYWDGRCHPMQQTTNGCWVLFVPEIDAGYKYKYEIKDPLGNRLPHKADPVGFYAEQYPSHSSVVYDHDAYQWNDQQWIEDNLDDKRFRPLSIYEVHLGSWRQKVEADGRARSLTYRELAEYLIPYVKDMGFTHIEVLPVSEHPFSGSWGYQPVGLFAPTSRFGTPDDFKYLVDQCHQNGIGVIVDWVPAHFPEDSHGLARFDGTHLYEYADPRKGWHPDWNSCIYDFGRDHVRQFLISNALFWLEKFHVDGLRVDAVASMLYLDYSRNAGEWIPNVDGGNHNYEAISLLKWFNEEVYKKYPHAMTLAEESTAFAGVSRPTFEGGLGFGFKWNMGWMHDSLHYISKDPAYRKYHHGELTFSMVYAYDENFVLPLSHDEVVHGKGSILRKMPGDEWQAAANMRAYMAFMYAHPGKKLNFMGNELGQAEEWNHDSSVQWHLLDYPKHSGIQNLFRDLNHAYRDTPAMYELDTSHEGFEWVDHEDADNSIVSFIRKAKSIDEDVIVISNFTPIPRDGYRLGVNLPGRYQVIVNSDSEYYWGSNYDCGEFFETEEMPWHGREQSLMINLPALSTLYLKRVK
ncbi:MULTISPECIES: 1,4-alpha-glucan branching protein GlgB [Corallincola]|uniref:1,4-alpha-glucan branching enzyme GlgB n=2 Tax=Corallincola TaxID=1775176 RepID=A0A368NLK9_9GAMM|nr:MULTISPECIES: 1,4-alpha-glucan branching protein GlgB [Corallincola]RCU50524.1 1,4-alpha-glucan branching protein GlgB [Corallincola holothuriorum]TAA48468.1 1,4-alpha-glucan branching protein GlgB [Corallincola spongiicola]